MGYAIANELAERGAEVTLVSGPVDNLYAHPNIRVIKVSTAEEMHKQCLEYFPDSDAAILSAAVADYKPEEKFIGKIKKTETDIKLSLSKTIDILSDLGSKKREDQVLIGFALETSDGRFNAEQKIKKKNLDFIVLNMLSKDNFVFGSDNNLIEIGFSDGKWKHFESKSKTEIAVDIVDQLLEQMNHE
jgi:phosphopantothenoylcysteine decarboxylase/phosphopantothenate--cysteine ligase